jgi:hypothetical protein
MNDEHRHADLLVRIHIDREPYDSPDSMTGATLYALGGIHHHHCLFREVTGDKEDELIEPNDHAIRLEQDEHFYSQKVFTIEVLYNGVKKSFEVGLQETVKHLLEQAIRAFGSVPNPHTLSLYRDGKELPDGQTLKEAGVRPHDVLLLRPSTVKGGS